MKRKGKIIMICIIVTILGFNYALTGCQDFNVDYVPSTLQGILLQMTVLMMGLFLTIQIQPVLSIRWQDIYGMRCFL